MEDHKSPKIASKDKKEKLIQLDKESLSNEDPKQVVAKNLLFKAADSLKPGGFKHTGSIAVHYYFSELKGGSYATQINVGGTSQYLTALSFNELFHKLRESYGIEMKQKES